MPRSRQPAQGEEAIGAERCQGAQGEDQGEDPRGKYQEERSTSTRYMYNDPPRCGSVGRCEECVAGPI
eukprot:11850301-Heterocapsa_arctica.AAC.1